MRDKTVKEIERGKYLEGQQELELIMQVENEEYYEINLPVESMQYKTEAIEVLYQKFLEELENEVLGLNTSWDHVAADLIFSEEIEGYPFKVTWETSDYKILSRTGERIIENFGENISNEGHEVTITATIRYLDFEKKIYFFPCLFLSGTEEKELSKREMERFVLDVEESTREESNFLLPEKIGEKDVEFQIVEDKNYIEWLVLLVIVIFGMMWVENDKLNREIDERKKRMERLYPEVVTKMTLLLCAGFTLRNVWEKMISDYELRGEKEFVYEHMKKANSQMKNGLSEGKTYEKFGIDCRDSKYRKLGNLLSQNLKRGNKNLIIRMKEESKHAYVKRKEMALIESGKAETKMLIPMLMLLMLVLLVVVVPVFMSV